MPSAMTEGILSILGRLQALGGFSASASAWHCRCPCPGHRNGDRNPSGRLWLQGGRLCVKCYAHGPLHSWKEWVQAVGLPKSAWFLESNDSRFNRAAPPEEITHRFVYQDDRGREAFQVLRTNWKRIWQQREYPVYDDQTVTLIGLGRGYYTKCRADRLDRRWKFYHETEPPPDGRPSIFAEAAGRVLYRLPDVLAAPFEEVIFFVEGEPKVDVLRVNGLTATCNPMGAGKLDPDELLPLQERPVVVLPDCDQAGYRHACLVAGALLMVGAASVSVASWLPEEVGEKGDIVDWVRRLGDRDVYRAVMDRFVHRGVPGRPETLPRRFAPEQLQPEEV